MLFSPPSYRLSKNKSIPLLYLQDPCVAGLGMPPFLEGPYKEGKAGGMVSLKEPCQVGKGAGILVMLVK